MARYKPVNYDQMEMIPLSFQDQIVEGSFEYTLSYLIDKQIDLSIFDGNYNNDETGCRAISPSILLKVILYAYSKGIISSRGIEEACRVNVVFKALSANTMPDHSTIAAFVSGMKDQIKDVFKYALTVCCSCGLLGGDMFAVDGCKLPSNAAKEWSGTMKHLRKKKEKFEEWAVILMNRHAEEDRKGNTGASEEIKRRMDKVLRKAEEIGEFLKNEEPKLGTRGKEVQSNMTDNESAKMKTNRGIIQGYNGLAVADAKHQVITAAEAFGTGQEGALLDAMAENAEENLKEVNGGTLKGKTLLADTNYFSEDNLRKMAERGINAVIPDQQFRKRDVRFREVDKHKPEKQGLYERERNFRYDEKRDVYLCPGKKVLKFSSVVKIGKYTMRKYFCRKSWCDRCAHRIQCVPSDKSRYRTLLKPVRVENRNYSDEMRRKIDSPEGRELYSKRMGIIEPVFANMTFCKKMNRFTMRGKVKADIQWLLYCTVHNIGKIQRFGKLK